MKHLALILLSSSFFTACMTEADKALWVETKDVFSSDGIMVAAAVAELKAAPSAEVVAEQDETPAKAQEALVNPKPAEATTGR